MQGVGWIMAIIAGGLAGWIASRMMKADHGLLKNIVLGIFGALVGNVLLTFLTGGTLTGLIGQIIVAVAGASLLIWIGRALGGR